jgi:hypothetical protein
MIEHKAKMNSNIAWINSNQNNTNLNMSLDRYRVKSERVQIYNMVLEAGFSSSSISHPSTTFDARFSEDAAQ